MSIVRITSKCRAPWVFVIVVVLALLLGAPAASQPAADDSAEARDVDASQTTEDAAPEIEGGLLPGAAALVPGILLHGSGTFAAGDRETGLALLKWQGISMLALTASFTELILTGASRKTIWLSAPGVLLSFGVFVQTWLADIYGAFSGSKSLGRPNLALPRLRLELGYRHVYDPQFDYRNFTYVGAKTWLDRVRLTSENWLAFDDTNIRTRLLVDWRIRGRTHWEYAANASTLDLRVGGQFVRFGNEGFSVFTPEVQMRGRLDLGEIGPSLEGAFADASVGVGFEVYDYDAPGLAFGSDINSLLLGQIGFGLFLFDGAPAGEVRLYYDHRHDTYAGGAHLSDLGGGVPGYFGLESHLDFGHWGVGADVKAGSAFIGGLHLRYNGWMPAANMPTEVP